MDKKLARRLLCSACIRRTSENDNKDKGKWGKWVVVYELVETVSR